MRLPLLFIISLLITTSLYAQDKDYAEKATQLEKEIWGSAGAEFKVTAVPAKLASEGAVVLARSFKSQWTSGGRFKVSLGGFGVAFHAEKAIVVHERVKINDKVALESFSTLEYQKKLDNSTTLFITGKLRNTKNTFIGAKIIKPDGREVIVNTGEEVLLKDETKDKKGKLAISDLQVGDILDYYIVNFDVSENSQGTSFRDNENVFILADEYPVLSYNIDFQFDKKVKTKYIYANGAPHFEESKNKDGDLLLSLKLHDLPKYQSHLWTSSLRQYPYIEIGSAYTNGYNYMDKEIAKQASMLEGEKHLFEQSFIEGPGFDESEKGMKDFFDSKKNMKNAPLDSVMKVLYDEWKFRTFCLYDGDELDNVSDLNYRHANSLYGAIRMCQMLTDLDVDHDVLIVSPRTGNTLDNVYGINDFHALIRINGGTQPMYMFFDDMATHFNEIPEHFQGEKAIVMHPKRHNSMRYTFTYSDAVIPVVPASENRSEETVMVSLMPDNMQRLKIDRTVRETGAMRHDDQKLLIPVKDVDEEYRSMINGETLAKRLSRSKATKKKVDDFNSAFSKEYSEQNKNFKSEIKGIYDQEPQQLISFKVNNPALENTRPVFEFNSVFTFDNMVKKAGNNLIIDVGKLCGVFMKLDEKDKKRDIDVYMPVARSFQYSIVLDLPRGYSAKGVEEIGQQKSNKTGSFSSVASVKGNQLIITVNRVYNNNFEKAADWPLLVDLIAAASDFNSKKILLEKQN